MDIPSVVLIMCGSLNPITRAHVKMLEQAAIFVFQKHHSNKINATGQPMIDVNLQAFFSPVNDGYVKKGLIASSHRIAMAHLALADHAFIKVDTWEAEQASYVATIEVLRHFQTRFPTSQIIFVCGYDLLESFTNPAYWTDEEVKTMFDFNIHCLQRGPNIDLDQWAASRSILAQVRPSLALLPREELCEISSTEIRQKIQADQSIDDLTYPVVSAYIREHQLYRA